MSFVLFSTSVSLVRIGCQFIKSPSRPSSPSSGDAAEAANYAAVKHLATEPGWYAFQYVWDHVNQNDPAMQELTLDIGGSHVAILVGQITADKTFHGRYYHIVRAEKTPVAIGKMDGQKLIAVSSDFTAQRPAGKTTITVKKLFEKPKITGNAVAAVATTTLGNKVYNIENFNCKIFADII